MTYSIMPTARRKSRKPSIATRSEPERAACEESNLSSGLLQLPAELRNGIYDFVLPRQQDLRSSLCWNQAEIFKQCLVMHACRQLRRETLSQFAGSNLFEIRLHFGTLHSKSLMNVLCLDPIASNALRHIEIVSSYACSHAHTMMPFFGCVSVLVDRDAGTVARAGPGSWTDRMECDRALKYGEVGEKCKRAREENIVRLMAEVEVSAIQTKAIPMKKADLEALADRMGKKSKKSKFNAVGRALKREASMVSNSVDRYRQTATFLG